MAHAYAPSGMTWWGRKTAAAVVALVATFVGFSGVAGEKISLTLMAVGMIIALGLGGRTPRSVREDR